MKTELPSSTTKHEEHRISISDKHRAAPSGETTKVQESLTQHQRDYSNQNFNPSLLEAQYTHRDSSPVGLSDGTIQLYSGRYYAACAVGGLIACGATHWMTTPLDLIKVRRQVNSQLYSGNIQGMRSIIASQGISGLFTGGTATALGYGVQGALKYGCYEFFKKTYADMVGPENTTRYKSLVYVISSASAELIADVGLCPFETMKVRLQTVASPSGNGFVRDLQRTVSTDGIASLYRGIQPLWARQIPYTVMKFASFETIVQMMYDRLPGDKSSYSKTAKTGIAFTAGYLAGILCAVVSHPADVMVSKLNANREQGDTVSSAVRRIYKDIGFKGLWNGLAIRTVMIGTLTGLQWMTYDSFKLAIGLPTTGSDEPSPQRIGQDS